MTVLIASDSIRMMIPMTMGCQGQGQEEKEGKRKKGERKGQEEKDEGRQ